jgi:hypothetical protein
MKKLSLIFFVFILVGCSSMKQNVTPYPAPMSGLYPIEGRMLNRDPKPYLVNIGEGNQMVQSGDDSVLVVPPNELRKWVFETELRAQRAERAAQKSEDSAVRCEIANAVTAVQVEQTKTLMQKMLDQAKAYVDKCQSIFDKILKK